MYLTSDSVMDSNFKFLLLTYWGLGNLNEILDMLFSKGF